MTILLKDLDPNVRLAFLSMYLLEYRIDTYCDYLLGFRPVEPKSFEGWFRDLKGVNSFKVNFI